MINAIYYKSKNLIVVEFNYLVGKNDFLVVVHAIKKFKNVYDLVLNMFSHQSF